MTIKAFGVKYITTTDIVDNKKIHRYGRRRLMVGIIPTSFFEVIMVTMKIKTAILIDGGWMALGLSKLLKVKYATAQQVYNNAISVLNPDEELYRMFYYDANPYEGEQENPISRLKIDFFASPSCEGRKRFFRDLNALPQVALRLGNLKFRGWKFVDEFQKKLLDGSAAASSMTDKDIRPNLTQKGVDMRIGIDIASLVFKKIVSRVILFCGDTDMIPAMKLARIEGVQIVVVQVGKKQLNSELIADSDFLRVLNPQP